MTLESSASPWDCRISKPRSCMKPGRPGHQPINTLWALILPDYLQRLGHNGDEVLNIGNHGGGAETSLSRSLFTTNSSASTVYRYTGRMVPSGITRRTASYCLAMVWHMVARQMTQVDSSRAPHGALALISAADYLRQGPSSRMEPVSTIGTWFFTAV